MDYINPDWEHPGLCHDWRNHVPEYVRVIWSFFSEEQKKALFFWADGLAITEEWD